MFGSSSLDPVLDPDGKDGDQDGEQEERYVGEDRDQLWDDRSCRHTVWCVVWNVEKKNEWSTLDQMSHW